MPRIEDISAFNAVREAGLRRLLPAVPRIAIGMGTCGRGNGAEALYQAFLEVLQRGGADLHLTSVGCFGACCEEPLINVHVPGSPLLILRRVQANDAGRIVHHLTTGKIGPELIYCKVEEWDHITGTIRYGSHGYPEVPLWTEVPFFNGQKKIVLRNCGLINPDDIEEYIAVGGYQALYKTLIEEKPEVVIESIKASKLRGRGGAGFLTGNKWEFLRKAAGEQKFVICNADEGDPGAYMNRNEIESDPHSLLEGMVIGGYAMGATQGIIYVRAEYPLAVRRLNHAIEQAREYGLLGDKILGRSFNFDIELVEGAGAFVCGEETALIASLEGHAGRPRPRPPFPAKKGLWGKPSNINNVETWYNIAPIITRGPEWFTETGSAKSSGTKVFSLVGKVHNSGLVEMPMGTPLKTFIYDIGGGGLGGRGVKAVQTGGPSGGCIPAEMFDTPVDYESLAQLGAIMGSGGMVVMDEDNCMVDVARYFVEFTNSESCGKCIPCRVGLNKCLRILNGITEGTGALEHLEQLDELSRYIRDCSLCGLGQTAPNPMLTTMRHFRQEFEDHIISRRCVAGICTNLALAPCENSCPLHVNIPRFMQLYKEGRLEDAFESLIMDNPLPCSTGRVCQHPCDRRCRRQTVDNAVNMREVHRYIADTILLGDGIDAAVKRVFAHKLPSTGRKIAVAGAGPTGLTAAFYLALFGHDVTVFDALAEAGGMLRFALPEYRLPKRVLAREVELIKRLGVKFCFDTRVGSDISLNELNERFDAVFLAIGTWKESWVYLPGTELKGVFSALPFLESVSKGESMPLGRKVAVIGGGNAAIDSARTALRMGANVTVVYRRERKDMPAIEAETLAAEDEGAKFIFHSAPHRIIGNSKGNVRALEIIKTRLGDCDRSGRRKPILTDEIQRLDFDSVIIAVGETVDLDFAKASGLEIKERGTIEVNHLTLETSRPRFFAGGDLVTGASNVSNAMAYGKQAARAIDEQLMDSKRWEMLFHPLTYDRTPPKDPSESRRHQSRVLPAHERGSTFDEVVVGLTNEQTHEECCRCLRCDVSVTASQ